MEKVQLVACGMRSPRLHHGPFATPNVTVALLHVHKTQVQERKHVGRRVSSWREGSTRPCKVSGQFRAAQGLLRLGGTGGVSTKGTGTGHLVT